MEAIPRRLVVGLNLGPEGESALQLLKWLRAVPGPALSATAVFVLGNKRVLKLLQEYDLERAAEVASAEARAVADRAGAVEAVDEIVVVGGDAPHELLQRVASERDAHVLVIGRDCGGRDGERLGTVGRAILKSLPIPTVVAPRALDADRLAQGPVIVAMTDRNDSIPAFRFALSTATARQREVIALHVVPALSSTAVFPNQAARQEQLKKVIDDAQTSFSGWLRKNGLAGARTAVVAGEPGSQIIAACERERAALVVCGSRRTSIVGRLFSHSVSSELAASAPCPVGVVPGA